jgi:hypothetical protein
MTVMPRMPQDSGDIDAALAEFFAACRVRVLQSFRLAESEGARMEEDTGIYQMWVGYNLTAARLIRTSLELADRLQGRGRETTHRILVERPAPSGASLPPAEPVPASGAGPGPA